MSNGRSRINHQHYEHEFSLSNLWASIFDPLEPPHCLPISLLKSAEVFGVVSRDSHIGCQRLCRQIRVALWLHPSTCLYHLSSHELARGENKDWPQAQFELSHERAALVIRHPSQAIWHVTRARRNSNARSAFARQG